MNDIYYIAGAVLLVVAEFFVIPWMNERDGSQLKTLKPY